LRDLGAIEPRFTEGGARKIAMVELRSAEVRLRGRNPGESGVLEASAIELRQVELTLCEIDVVKSRLVEAGEHRGYLPEVRVLYRSLEHAGLREPGAFENGAAGGNL